MKHSDDQPDKKVISFFSGAMGLDLGLEQAGLNIVIGQDLDQTCINTMKINQRTCLEGDIRNIFPEEVLDIVGLKRGEPFLICGGPPCQPFSTAGKRLGINDPRGSLFIDFVRMINYIRPRFFIMENVKGIMSAHIKNEDGTEAMGTVLDIILSEFDKLKYKTVYGILDAVNYGVPQFRERFVLIGSRDNESIFLPLPTHFQTHQNSDMRWKTLSDAFDNLDYTNDEYITLSKERAYYLKMVPEGGNWKNLPIDVLPIAMGGAYKSGGGKVGFYRRLSFSQPSPTVVTSPAQKATMMCHPIENRPLSLKEYARIQQFPDDWIFTGTLNEKYRQIGNAVPLGLAKAIGEAVLATSSGNASIETKRFRGTGVHNKIHQAIMIGGNNGSDKHYL